jgi:hypothetical protein
MARLTNKVKTYLLNKYTRLNINSRYMNGEMYHCVDGEWVDDKKLDELIPPLQYRKYKDMREDNPNLKYIS